MAVRARVILIRVAPVDTWVLLEEVALRFRSTHRERPLSFWMDEPLPRVLADVLLVRRVLDILLDDAHEHTRAPCEPIGLTAWRYDEGGVVIEVKDHGVDRVRAGFALARRIIAANEGSLTSTSDLRNGNVARMRLPAVGARSRSSDPLSERRPLVAR